MNLRAPVPEVHGGRPRASAYERHRRNSAEEELIPASLSERSVARQCLDALRVDSLSRMRFTACVICACVTTVSLLASVVYVLIGRKRRAAWWPEFHPVKPAALLLCLIRGSLWTILEFFYLVLSVYILGKSRDGLLFSSNRKSPLRATCAAMLVMTLKAVITPWDHLISPVGVKTTNLTVDCCELIWYVVLIFDELVPLAYMLFVLSRVTISSIKKTRRSRIVSKSPSKASVFYGYGSNGSIAPINSGRDGMSITMCSSSSTTSSSGPFSTSLARRADGSDPISVPAPPDPEPDSQTSSMVYSQGASLMSANLILENAHPVADEVFSALMPSGSFSRALK